MEMPLLMPSVGEYPIYDPQAYEFMIADKLRTDAYREAVRALAPGRVVLDIGTGQDAIWAVTAAKAGASRVYAIEVLRDAAKLAREAVDRAGVADRVTILEGLSTEIELPEQVDLLVSEIIGTIGGSEGAEAVLDDARRRFLKPGGHSIPHRCVTTVAAVDLGRLMPDLAFAPIMAPYVEQVFASVGRPFDLRLCLMGLGRQQLMSTQAEVEDLRFEELRPGSGVDRAELRVTRAGRMHGLGLGIRLWITEEGTAIDSIAQWTNWAPVFVPVSESGLELAEGDVVSLEFTRKLSADGVHPDYGISGVVRRGDAVLADISWESPHGGGGFRENPVHRSLFPLPR
ncbi:50S ribosomal protein L11 methyltransferase [Allokutzneria sp. A3M-2-11 16]|uniref:methyltransferase domain-containing protein n=1 Tax=Allokutzneria sp. A3M-2-11 16 TaxID=2962043 RepID=UPI0020B6AB0F|nr:methyltransferase domain-containing protein [Allokutzneria sp. A3M-2-11 16]MCP3804686.1 50S ribosomal protein L11 methyltransferase [Allokutzneria sp. A3M-2-11 16]